MNLCILRYLLSHIFKTIEQNNLTFKVPQGYRTLLFKHNNNKTCDAPIRCGFYIIYNNNHMNEEIYLRVYVKNQGWLFGIPLETTLDQSECYNCYYHRHEQLYIIILCSVYCHLFIFSHCPRAKFNRKLWMMWNSHFDVITHYKHTHW